MLWGSLGKWDGFLLLEITYWQHCPCHAMICHCITLLFVFQTILFIRDGHSVQKGRHSVLGFLVKVVVIVALLLSLSTMEMLKGIFIEPALLVLATIYHHMTSITSIYHHITFTNCNVSSFYYKLVCVVLSRIYSC